MKGMLPPLSTTSKLPDSKPNEFSQQSLIANIRDQYQSMILKKKILKLTSGNHSQQASAGGVNYSGQQMSRVDMKVLDTVLEIDQANMLLSSKRGDTIDEEDQDEGDQVNFGEHQSAYAKVSKGVYSGSTGIKNNNYGQSKLVKIPKSKISLGYPPNFN